MKGLIKITAILLLLQYQTAAMSQCCNYNLVMQDTYGDGWNDGYLEIFINSVSIGTFNAIGFGSSETFEVCDGDDVTLMYTPGMYENENSYQLLGPSWNVIFSDGPNPSTGEVYNGIGDCSEVIVPGIHPCTAIPVNSGDCFPVNNFGVPGTGIIPNCANYQGGDLWYVMEVPSSGNLSFAAVAGTLNDTGIAAWIGDLCSNLQIIGCDDDTGEGYLSILTLYDLTPGQTLYIQAWGYAGGTGSFEICITEFASVDFQSSELPIIMINTLGQNIEQEDKIDCLMDIKYNGPGNLTFVSDVANVYSGNIGIEIRGATSAGFPQKPYGIETRDALGENNNVSILGMPAENDWVLLSNFNDRSLIRNALAFKLFEEMDNYSVRTSLCEVMIDDSYKGIYVFGEKIKKDAGRVNIATLTDLDIVGDELTGGYILQQNYWNASNSFESNYSPIDHPDFDIHFRYEYPKPEIILEVQKTYIASFVDSLETALYSENFADPIDGYRKFLDTPSFIDYFIVNELARNADGFKKSVFFNKDKNSNGGKLKAGPVWDFDWAWKNLGHCINYSNFDGAGWAHLVNDCPTDNYSTGWYLRLIQDETFNEELRCTYESYRETMLDTTYLFSYIDSIGNLVQNAQARHFQKWPILGISGSAPEIGQIATTYSAELDTLKNWINIRLQWLDENIPGLCSPIITSMDEHDLLVELHCFPNPATNQVQINYSLSKKSNVKLSLYNLTGTEVLPINNSAQAAGMHSLNLNTSILPCGMYIIRLEQNSATTIRKLVVTR